MPRSSWLTQKVHFGFVLEVYVSFDFCFSVLFVLRKGGENKYEIRWGEKWRGSGRSSIGEII